MRRRERTRVAGSYGRSKPVSDIATLLRASADAQGISLEADQVDRLETFLTALLEWRATTSLVAQRDPAVIIAKHVEDAFAATALVRGPIRLADLGTGAGFPGMVVALLRPDSEVLLVESKRRKASYLRDAIRRTQALNARVIEARAEDLAGKVAGLDLVLSRAVWPGDTFFELARPLLRPGGLAVAMKAPEERELALPIGYGRQRRVPYSLSAGERRLLVMAEAG